MDESLFKVTHSLSASDAISECFLDYQIYLADSKLPNPIDGLKDVSRRVIYLMGTNKEELLMTKFVAQVTDFHPHGDGSISDVVHRLLQYTFYRWPLVHTDGNKGGYSDPEAAASRYIDVTSAELSRDLFFNGVNKHTLSMQPTYDFTNMEPSFFIPRLPTALIIGNLTIGIGFKSVTLPLNLSNVCELVQRYAEHMDKQPLKLFPISKYAELLVPDFPTLCHLRNFKQIVDEYKHGNYKCSIVTDGTMSLNRTSADIETITALIPFSKMISKLYDQLKDKNTWIAENCQDVRNLSSTTEVGRLVLDFKRNANMFSLLDNIKKAVRFTGKVTPICCYELNNKVVHLYPPHVLKLWYETRYQSIVNGINHDQNRLFKEYLYLEALRTIIDDKDKVIDLIRKSDNKDHAIHLLSDNFNLTNYQASVIVKSPLEKLIRSSVDSIKADIDVNQRELTTVKDKVGKINEIIYEDATMFKKKYNTPRKTKIMAFVGYVHINNYGIIQYSTEYELFSILNNFNNCELTIHQYRENRNHVLIQNNRIVTEDELTIPKETYGSCIMEYSGKDIYTIAYGTDNDENTVSCIRGLIYPTNTIYRLQFVNRSFIGIHQNGAIENMTVEQLSQRKSISRGAKSTLLYASHKNADNCIVAYMSTSKEYANVLRFTKINGSDEYNKLITTPPGELVILDILPSNSSNSILNLPKQCLDKCTINHVYINNLEAVMGEDIHVSIDFRSSAYKLNGKNTKIKRHDQFNQMVTI